MLAKIFKKIFPPLKKSKKNSSALHTITIITSRDIRALAGESMMATQLDLARAYMELGKKNLAKQILNHVYKNGSHDEKNIAAELLLKL